MKFPLCFCLPRTRPPPPPPPPISPSSTSGPAPPVLFFPPCTLFTHAAPCLLCTLPSPAFSPPPAPPAIPNPFAPGRVFLPAFGSISANRGGGVEFVPAGNPGPVGPRGGGVCKCPPGQRNTEKFNWRVGAPPKIAFPPPPAGHYPPQGHSPGGSYRATGGRRYRWSPTPRRQSCAYRLNAGRSNRGGGVG